MRVGEVGNAVGGSEGWGVVCGLIGVVGDWSSVRGGEGG